MHGPSFLVQAFVYLAAAVVAVPIAKRLGLGSVLGYLLAGVAIGPFGFGFIGTGGEDIMHFAEFGVVMMLFIIGLELEPATLWRLRVPLLGMGGLQVALTAFTGLVLGIALGLAWQPALAVGLILALSSTAIVLQTLAEKGLMRTDAGQRSFAVLLFQDIAVIPILALLPLLATYAAAAGEADHGLLEALPAWARAVATVGAVVAVIILGRVAVRPAFRVIARTGLRELFTAASLLLVIGIALLMTTVGLSPALGTFLAGVVLANSEFRHELQGDIEPFKGLLLGLFFLAVGASVDFGLIGRQAGTVAGLVLLLVAGKLAILLGLGRAFRMSLDQNILYAFALAQGGEFGFVLLSFAGQEGVLPAGMVGLLVAVVAVSMALTPVLLLLYERVLAPRVGTTESAPRAADAIDEERPVIIAGFGRFGSIAGRLLLAHGVRATVLDHDSDQVAVLRRLGLEVYYGDASREDLLRAAGAERARLVIVATDDAEKTREITATVRRHFPQAEVLARAWSYREAQELHDLGVAGAYRETLDSALHLGVDALGRLGIHPHLAWRSAQAFRRRDEAHLRELGAMRDDQATYFDSARQRIRDMERTLRADLEAEGTAPDTAWDAESLRREFGDQPRDA